jgi:hypothetical protein
MIRFRHCGFSGFWVCLGIVSLASGMQSVILAEIAPSLFEGLARRFGYLSAAAVTLQNPLPANCRQPGYCPFA